MRVLLSPAKTFRKEDVMPEAGASQPLFLDEASTLMAGLQAWTPVKLAQTMDLSAALAEETAARHLSWSLPFHPGNAQLAVFAFHGEVYRHLGAERWTTPELERAQNSLRILSGLYGVLRPMDLIQEYRLEMGTRWAPGKSETLYAFWGDLLKEWLEADADGGPIVNLASQEYAKAARLNQMETEVTACSFKEERDGTFKMIGTYAKAARGKMARFIIKNDLTKSEDLRAFDEDGYTFNPSLSSRQEFVFTRSSS